MNTLLIPKALIPSVMIKHDGFADVAPGGWWL